MKIFEVPAADLSERGRKLLQGSGQELERVAEHHVIASLDMEILLLVLQITLSRGRFACQIRGRSGAHRYHGS